ncbi:hypothetical protein BJ138DRAFT_1145088 [Hygrophoropsis aurantiaca]|uniref:Uncharacterized protein n=1 Tax=Hygrophoropsis aurantiaca TaxID=72124 RepID=A0ACB8AKY4_9AGAM|nr:hypothetical protein BJ138DRAFT_1145088 [Hygrophoropsis aurantiaca]
MPKTVEVIGSSVRDFCMLERNFLAHIKLVLLLLLLSSSALLGIRLPGPSGSKEETDSLGTSSLPVATIQFIAALATIGAAYWEYHTGYKDLLRARAFLVVTRVHLAVMSVVSVAIVATCVVYLVKSG